MDQKEGRVIVFFGDPATGVVERRSFRAGDGAFADDCRAALGCPSLEAARIPGLEGYVAWVDEEGLCKPQAGAWRVRGRTTGYAGAFVLVPDEPAGDQAQAGAVAGMIETFAARVWLDPARPEVDGDGLGFAVVPTGAVAGG